MDDHATNLLNPETPQDNATRFKDTNGRTYQLKITVGQVMKLKAELGLDLFAAADGSMFQSLGEDPMKICELLWFLVKDQAIKHYLAETPGASDSHCHGENADEVAAILETLASESFWQAIDETALDAATMAFFESLIAFFQEGKREPLRLVLQKMKKAETTRNANRLSLAQSDKVDRVLEVMLNQELRKAEASMEQVIRENSGPRTGGP